MPGYNTQTPTPPALYPSDSYNLFNAESKATITGTTSGKSQQVCLASDNVNMGQQACVVEVAFSADPGAFTLLIEFADTDSDAYYIAPTVGGTINSVNSAFHASYQYDAPGTLGRFVRAHLTSLTNSVNTTVTVSR